jgi:beta-galactosidase
MPLARAPTAAALALLLAAAPVRPALGGRVGADFNGGWRFQAGVDPAYVACTPATGAVFPVDLTGVWLTGLNAAPAAKDAAACAAACAAVCTCQAWQWDAAGGQGCWTGLLQALGPSNWNTNGSGWVGAGRYGPAVPPSPQTAGPAAPGYDDAGWLNVTLPHDYLSYGTPVYSADVTEQRHGYVPFSDGWYRKTFTVPAEWAGALVRLHFGGVYRSWDLFLDGVWLGHHESGYTAAGWWVHNATPGGLAPGVPHVVAVHVDGTTFQEGWYWEGAGITRDVTLTAVTPEGGAAAAAVSIVPDGVFVRSAVGYPVAGTAFGPQTADVTVLPTVDVANDGAGEAAAVVLTCTVTDPAGAVVATVETAPLALPPGGWARLAPAIPLKDAQLWFPAGSASDPDRPLYTLTTSLAVGGVAVDDVDTVFGIRDAVFTPDRGLLVNGFPVKVTGMAMHGDFGGSGMGVPANLVRYRVARLQETGGLGWRTAHNPPDAPLLDTTDARGVLVWVENRLLRAPAPGAPFLDDAAAMVRAARNHPSVFIYSLCNENGCLEAPGAEGATAPAVAGAAVAAAYAGAMRPLDATRPITGNTHALLDQPGTILDALDVLGVTYDYGAYDSLHAARPFTPVMGGEAASCVSDRGFSAGDNGTAGTVGSYDPLGCTGPAWAAAATRPWIAGNFEWAGADYGGESEWPAVSSHYGTLDLCGFDKPSAGWYRAWWGGPRGGTPDGSPPGNATELTAFPEWDGAGFPADGTVSVVAFTSAPGASLAVNGVPVGGPDAVVPVPRWGYARWDGVRWAPGNYTVTALTNASGSWVPVATHTSVTPGATAGLALSVAWPGSGPGGALLADGADAALVTVAAVDGGGRVVTSDSATNVTFAVSGGPVLVSGSCSGFPADHVSLRAPHRVLYAGLARVTLRSVLDAGVAPGTVVTLTATAPGLPPATLSLPVAAPPPGVLRL